MLISLHRTVPLFACIRNCMSKFLDRLATDRPLIYDGGFGSELFARGIELTNSTLANEAHPDAVVDIHKAYIAAGADLIGTNTFVASELHLEMAGKDPDQAGALTRTATDLARRAIAEAQSHGHALDPATLSNLSMIGVDEAVGANP